MPLVIQLMVLLMAMTLDQVALAPSTEHRNAPFDQCLTPACVQAANNARQLMDPSVDPCDNFYDYACGRSIKYAKTPRNNGNIGSLKVIAEKVEAELLDLIQAPIDLMDTKPTAMAKQYFSDCMDVETREAVGSKPWLELVRQMGGWPMFAEADEIRPAGKWWQLAAKYAAAGLWGDSLVNIGVRADSRQQNRTLIYLSPPTLSTILKKLQKPYYRKVILELGAVNGTRLQEDLKNVVHFISELNLKIGSSFKTLSTDDQKGAIPSYTLFELHELHPYVDWTKYINSQLPQDVRVRSSDSVFVHSIAQAYLKNLGETINKTSERVVANFMVLCVLDTLIPFTHKTIFGNKKTCLKLTKSKFNLVLDALYVRRYFDNATRDAASNLVTKVQKILINILSDVEWLDSTTKQRAIQKLTAMRQVVGYPEQLLDNSKLEQEFHGVDLSNGSFFTNSIKLINWQRTQQFAKLKSLVEIPHDWADLSKSSTVGAFYATWKNTIIIPAALLQENVFSLLNPNYINFASIGTIIGHEMSHAFDSTGRRYDEQGNLADWWEPNTALLYEERATCVRDQYADFIDPDTEQTLNANLTLAEDISDNEGVQLMYRTYQLWASTEKEPELRLPGLDLTPNQIFWLSYGQLWCGKRTTKTALYIREHDIHSPLRFRVNGPLQNSKGFPEDFGCPVGGPMNPEKKCRLW